jgi:hypothetical protein
VSGEEGRGRRGGVRARGGDGGESRAAARGDEELVAGEPAVRVHHGLAGEGGRRGVHASVVGHEGPRGARWTDHVPSPCDYEPGERVGARP